MKIRKEHILWFIAVFVLAVVIGLYFWKPWTKKTDFKTVPTINKSDVADYLSKQGEAAYKKRYYQTLIATYQKVLTAAPDNVETKKTLAKLYYELAVLENEQGNKPKTKENLKEALKLDPTITETDKRLKEFQIK